MLRGIAYLCSSLCVNSVRANDGRVGRKGNAVRLAISGIRSTT